MINWYPLKHQGMKWQAFLLYYYPFAVLIAWQFVILYIRGHINSVLFLYTEKQIFL